MKYFNKSCLTEVRLRGLEPPTEDKFLRWVWSRPKLAELSRDYSDMPFRSPFGLKPEHREILFDEMAITFVGHPWPKENDVPGQFRAFAKAFVHCMQMNGWTALDSGTS